MRRFAQPEKIAASIAFLAGKKAGFITGQTFLWMEAQALGVSTSAR